MPDLTQHTAFTCETNRHYEAAIQIGNGPLYCPTYGFIPGGKYDYGWTCECPFFEQGNKTCGHIEKAKKQRCGWNQEADPGLEPEVTQEGDRVCPSCKGPVVAVRVAV